MTMRACRAAPGDHAGECERADLSDTALGITLAACAASALAYLAARPVLPVQWTTPGSPVLYLTGVAGSMLMLAPLAFTIAKRSGLGARPPAWFAAHVVLTCIGLVLLLVHSGLHLGRAPALLVAAGAFLVVQGAWARTRLPRRIAAVFGTRHEAFVAPDAGLASRLRAIIDEKHALLARLAPDAHEATFSPRAVHCLAHPVLTRRYRRLAREEMRTIGQRGRLPAPLVRWRALHMAVAALFVLGLVVHVVTVTFFAGYVAAGGDIDWWHVTAWGAPGSVTPRP